jgi:XapX domain-containing protein
MKLSVVSLAVGHVVGVLYVRSPAPPVVVGLLGILMGEQVPPLVRHVFARTPASVTRIDQVKPHVFGSLPAGRTTPEKPS